MPTGLVVRLIGAGAFTLSAIGALGCTLGEDSNGGCQLSAAVLLGGTLTAIGGALYDIGTTRRSVRAWNQRHGFASPSRRP